MYASKQVCTYTRYFTIYAKSESESDRDRECARLLGAVASCCDHVRARDAKPLVNVFDACHKRFKRCSYVSTD
jgi:hypothetical protein